MTSPSQEKKQREVRQKERFGAKLQLVWWLLPLGVETRFVQVRTDAASKGASSQLFSEEVKKCVCACKEC